MSSWRARIGYLSPSVFEIPSDWSRILPPGFSLVTTGLNVRAHTEEEFDRAIRELESALGVFVAEEVDAILIAGITLATQRGYSAEGEVTRALSEKLGLPVATAMSANVEALRRLGARRIVIATAYLESINRRLARYFEDAGFRVLAVRGLGVAKPVEQAKLAEDASYHAARALAEAFPEADAVLVHGRWSSLEACERLEREIARPVLSSVAAGLWWIVSALRLDVRVARGGSIFRKP
jgi:arylmalonate decarboxylase